MNPFPTPFPPTWATAWGEDCYGLYAEFEVGGIVQVCRWIPPGAFMIGSPGDEPGRWANEWPPHEVTLSGFWLADTACTQTLWCAVMGKNPAHFQGNDLHPVEQVSWHDCQAFFDKLNQLFPELAAWFPTEAEWEYACRAGTSTTFSFGANISTEQVNFSGHSHLSGEQDGLYRGKTIPVATLPANAWGLYEMHGNVTEWCDDWYGDYGVTREADIDRGHALRGGSYADFGRDVRSARRSPGDSSLKNSLIGFRLSPGGAKVRRESGIGSQNDGPAWNIFTDGFAEAQGITNDKP